MRFSKLVLALFLPLLFPAIALAVVGVTSSELQDAASIIVPDGDALGELSGYSAFSLQETSTLSGGVIAEYEARLLSDPWSDDELPKLQLLVLSYSDQDSAQATYDRILNAGYFSGTREMFWHDDRTLLYESETSSSADIFGTVSAEYLSLHMIHVNGKLLYQASIFREDGTFHQENLQTYAEVIEDTESLTVILEDAIENSKLALGILFPPTGTDLSTKSEKSSLALSDLYSVPQHGTIGFDLYVGETEGAVGTILDSSGIAEADEGDLYLYISSDGTLYAGIYAPLFDADCTQQSGWYRISTLGPIFSYEWNSIELHYGVGGFSISLNGEIEAACSVSQPRSDNELFFGDYPYDSIEESMIGYVNDLVMDFSTTSSGLVWDEVLSEQLFLDLYNSDPDLAAFQYLKEAGIFMGSDGMLYPDNDLNRAEMVKVLLKAYGYEAAESGSVTFWDVEDDAWYLKYLISAYEIGMVEGNPDGSFSPGGGLNRAEFFTMLYRIADPGKISYEDDYIDVDSEDWYVEAAAFAAAYGLVDGSYFGASKTVTRREAAVALYTLLK